MFSLLKLQAIDLLHNLFMLFLFHTLNMFILAQPFLKIRDIRNIFLFSVVIYIVLFYLNQQKILLVNHASQLAQQIIDFLWNLKNEVELFLGSLAIWPLFQVIEYILRLKVITRQLIHIQQAKND